MKVKMFTHNDLDGVSCAIVLAKLYDMFKVYCDFQFISYNRYDEIKKFFDPETGEASKFDYVFITDLNFTKSNYEKFLKKPLEDFIAHYNNPNYFSIFKKIFFIDHHIDSDDTFRNENNNLIEYTNDLTHCASFQLAEWCIDKISMEWTSATSGFEIKDFDISKKWVLDYIKYVNDWDLFLWKENGNIKAKDLNLLFTHIRRDKFVMMQRQKNNSFFNFNKGEKIIVNETNASIERDFHEALLNNKIQYDWNIQCDYMIIRTDENVSIICDKIKEYILNDCQDERTKNIKYIANVSFKYGSINFRRIDENIDLQKIANRYNGGGHPFAAGCVIDSRNKQLMVDFIYPILDTYTKN